MFTFIKFIFKVEQQRNENEPKLKIPQNRK